MGQHLDHLALYGLALGRCLSGVGGQEGPVFGMSLSRPIVQDIRRLADW
jgi:hypothetical protein